MQKLLKSTKELEKIKSVCTECRRIVDASLFIEDNDIYLLKECSIHGLSKHLFWRDAKLYLLAKKTIKQEIACSKYSCLQGNICKDHSHRTYNLLLNITNKCNLKCPVCFAGEDDSEDLSVSKIDAILQKAPKKNPPNVVIIGGEPTLHKDLKEIIKLVVHKGYIPRLATNGIRLLDSNYLKDLQDAGLQWICLQFDGVKKDTYIKLRGEDLLLKKINLLKKLTANGLKIQLMVNITSSINMQEAGNILDMIFKYQSIFWVSFYPTSSINRQVKGYKNAHIADVVKHIEEKTRKQIKQQDFLQTMKIFDIAYKLTKKPMFRQKVFYFSLIITKVKNKYIPLNRFLNPFYIIRYFNLFIRIICDLRNILNYQKKGLPEYLKVIVISKFFDENAIDIKEIGNEHMAYVTEKGSIPFNIYNIFYRNKVKIKCPQI